MEEKRKEPNVFQNRNFRLVFFGALVSEMGGLLYSFAVGFYILEITDNNALLQGIYLAVCGVTSLIFILLGGVLGDRYNRAKIMFLCDYARGGLILAATLFMLLFPGNTAHVIILFAVGFLGNVIGGIFSPAASALLPNIIAEDRLQQANSYNTIRNSLQVILGILLAGVLYAALPVTVLFVMVGAAYLLSGVSEMFIRYEHRPPENSLSVRQVFADMRAGYVYLRGKQSLMALMSAFLLVNFFFAPIGENFLPYFVKTDIAGAPSYLLADLLTPELWSSVISVLIGLSTLVGAAILSSRQQEEEVGQKVARRTAGSALIIILMSFGYWILVDRGLSLNLFLLLLAAGSFALGFFLVFVNVPISTLLMRTVDKQQLSKVSSIISVVTQGLVPIAAVLAGLILQYLGTSALLFFCAAGSGASALMLLTSRKVREL